MTETHKTNYHYFNSPNRAERCPVCGGNGIVPNGFYTQLSGPYGWTTTSSMPETCKGCNGSGWVVV
jgi:DnaJ-class molecular chaperone